VEFHGCHPLQNPSAHPDDLVFFSTSFPIFTLTMAELNEFSAGYAKVAKLAVADTESASDEGAVTVLLAVPTRHRLLCMRV
jgi:hypothetical protein